MTRERFEAHVAVAFSRFALTLITKNPSSLNFNFAASIKGEILSMYSPAVHTP